MKNAKRYLSLLLAVLMIIASVAGCGPKKEENTAKTRATTNGKKENSYTSSINEKISSLDPEMFVLQAENEVSVQIYEPLFFMDNDGNFVNVLIESYEDNGDGTVSFTLKDGITFQSGDTLVAEDVAYTLSRCENASLVSDLYAYSTIDVIDDTHFTWNFPYYDQGAGFAELCSYISDMGIVNKSFCEGIISEPGDSLGMNADGTGAYEFVEMDNAGNVTLKRYEGYHGEASIDTLNFKFITGDSEIAFESGDIDGTVYTASNYKLIKEYENVYAYDVPINNFAFITLNCVEGQPTADINVRQAIAYSLNREDICSIGSEDSGRVAYNLATPGCDYFDEDAADHFDQDLKKANELMTAAGYSESNKLELTCIVISAYPAWVAAAEVMKEQLEQSYFTVTIEEVATTDRYFAQDYDLGVISIGLGSTFAGYSLLFDASTGLNLSGLAGAEDEEILAAFAAIKDEDTAREAMKISAESLAYIPLWYQTMFLAYDADLNVGPFYVNSSLILYREFSWKK